MVNLKHILFVLCVVMINLGLWQKDIHIQMCGIFWLIAHQGWKDD